MIAGRSHLALLVAAVCISGCGSRVAYSPPAASPVGAPVVLDGSFETVWSSVIQTFFERNITIKTLEKASGLLESDELAGEIGRTCDCGSWLGVPIAGYGAYGGDAYYRFRVLVEQRDPQHTALTLRSSCRAHNDRVEGELVCNLSKAKEEELRTAITARLQSSR